MLNRANVDILDYIQLRPRLIVIFPDLPRRSGARPGSDSWAWCPDESEASSAPRSINTRTYTGEFTKYSRKNFLRSVDTLFELAPWRKVYNPTIPAWQNFHLSITTLTLSARPQNFTNKQATSQLLNHWLTTMRRNKGMRYYVWKAELQDNLNIHYHILSDLFCPHNEVRNIWNSIQSKAGIIQLFHDKHGHYNPNSTDIHTVKNYTEIAEYLKKYTTKPATNEHYNSLSADQQKDYKIGKVWDCSENLNNIPYPTELQDNELTNWLHEQERAGRLERISDPFFTLLKPTGKTRLIDYPPHIVRRIKKHYQPYKQAS